MKPRPTSEPPRSLLCRPTTVARAPSCINDEGIKGEVESHLHEMNPSMRGDLASKSGSETVAAERTAEHGEDS